MFPKRLVHVLQEFGLNEKEASVYLSMLALGESSVQKIAESASVKRPTAYVILESLKKKGLVNTVIRGSKKGYAAESPERLETVIEQRRQHLLSALPELLSLQQGEREGTGGLIRYYEGLDAIKNVYHQILKGIKHKDPFLMIAKADDWLALAPGYLENFLRQMEEKSAHARLLLVDTPAAQTFKKSKKDDRVEILLLNRGVALTTSLVITSQLLFLHQLKPSVSGIAIENNSAIKTHMELFEIIWNSTGTIESLFKEPIIG